MENDSNKISIASIARENDDLLKSTLGYKTKSARAESKISKLKRQKLKDILQQKYTWHVGYNNRQIVRKKLNRTSFAGKQMSSFNNNSIEPVMRSMKSNAINEEFGICMERSKQKIIFLVPEELASSIEIVKIIQNGGRTESISPASVEMLENAVESDRIDASESFTCNNSESRVRTTSSSGVVPNISSNTPRTKFQNTLEPRTTGTSSRDQPIQPHSQQLDSAHEAVTDAAQPSGSVGPIRIGLTHRKHRNSPYPIFLQLQNNQPDNTRLNSTQLYPSVKEEILSLNKTFDEPADVDGWERYQPTSNPPVNRPPMRVLHNNYRNSPNHGRQMNYYDSRSTTHVQPTVKEENNNTPSRNTFDNTNNRRGNQDVLRESNCRTDSSYGVDNRMYNRPAESANYHQSPSRSGPIRHRRTRLRRLSQADYYKCIKYHLCLNCQGNSHLVRNCPFPVPIPI